MATDFTSQITAWYQAVEYRNPPASELAVYNASLQSGALTSAQVQSAIINDPFTTTIVDAVVREYQAAFGRVPDQAGASYWVNAIAANPAMLSQLNTIFANSAEFTARFGATATTTANSALVSALYTNVYGRAPDAAGLAYWSTSGLNAAQLLQAFANAQEFVTQTTPAIQAFQQMEVAGTAPSTGSLFNVAPPGGGSNFALTTGVDFITGTAGADTIVADNTQGAGKYTLTAADTINGGAGTDTLKVYSDASAAAIAGVTTANITNVENLFVNNIGANNLDVSNTTFTGLQIDAPGASGLTFTLKGQSFTLSNDTAGGNTFTLASTSDTTENITLSKVGAKGANDTIDLSGTKVTSATINSTGGSNFLTLTDTGAALTSLTITGDQKLSLTEAVAGVKTINASGDTGGVTVDTSGTALNAAFTFTGGSGNDNLILKAGAITALTAGTQLDGGAGKDTLTLNDTAWTASDYSKLAAVKNFEVLALGTTGATLDASQVTNFKEFAVSTGTETITNAANGSILDINGATTAVAFSAAVGATAATINLGQSTSGGFTTTSLTTTGFTNLTLNVAGTSAETITALHNADNSNIVINGSTDLTIGKIDATTTGSKVDASAFTGKFTLTDSGKGDVILTGTGTTTITESSSTNADNITFKAGHTTVDTLVLSAQYVATDIVNNYALGQDVLTSGAGTLVKGAELGAVGGVVASGAFANAAAFVTAAEAATFTAKDAVVWYDAVNNNTYVAESGAGGTNAAHIVELVGVHATGIGAAGSGAANVIIG